MDDEQFWSTVESLTASFSAADRVEPDEEILRAALMRLDPAELVGFQSAFDRLHDAAYRWDLWGAAYVLDGGCGDDSFIDFRYWLIWQGGGVYRRVMADPDSLVDVARPGLDGESLGYLAIEAYEELTGEEMERDGGGFTELGEGWDFDDVEQMRSRYPRLFAEYGPG